MDHDDIQLEFSDNAIQNSVSDSVKTMYRDHIREREGNPEENEWYKALINIGGESK